MKVTREESKFKPITIVLESEHEVRVLQTLVGNIIKGGKFKEVTNSLYDNLVALGVKPYPHFNNNFDTDKVDMD